MSDGRPARSRPVSPSAYAGLGAIAFLAALACAGVAYVALQLDGWGPKALGLLFVAGAVGLLVLSVRALRRGRVYQEDDPRGAS